LTSKFEIDGCLAFFVVLAGGKGYPGDIDALLSYSHKSFPVAGQVIARLTMIEGRSRPQPNLDVRIDDMLG
jgi:hypothetical protein